MTALASPDVGSRPNVVQSLLSETLAVYLRGIWPHCGDPSESTPAFSRGAGMGNERSATASLWLWRRIVKAAFAVLRTIGSSGELVSSSRAWWRFSENGTRRQWAVKRPIDRS